MPAGGIAELAAQAALRMSKEQRAGDASPNPPTSGIAALPSQASLKMSNKADESPPAHDIVGLTAQASMNKPISIGEIAELAAKAALEISLREATNSESSQETTDGIITALSTKDTVGNSEKVEEIGSCSDSPAGGITTPEKLETLEKDSDSKPPVGGMSSLDVPEVTLEATPKRSSQNGVPFFSPTDGMSSLNARVVLEKSPKQSPKENTLKASPTAAPRSLLADQVEHERTPKQSPQDETFHRSPTVARSSLAAQAALEEAQDQSPKNKTLNRSPIGGSPSLATQVSTEKSQNQSPQEKTSNLSLRGGTSPLATQVATEKSQNQSPQDKTPNFSPAGGPYSLATQVAIEKTQSQLPSLAAQVVIENPPKRSPTDKSPQPLYAGENSSPAAQIATENKKRSPQRSPAAGRSSLSLMLERTNILSPKIKSPNRSPVRLMSSLSMAIENAKQKDANKRKGPSLGSFFERQNHEEVSRQEVRNEILRQNFDDSSVAMMAETMKKDQMNGSALNQGGGIADYIGWANQAIKASDTESVRDFETARDILYDDQSTIATNMDDSTYATNFDDGTIATNFDDDASIGTAMTPRNDLGNLGGGGGQEYYNSEQYDNYIGSADDPYHYAMSTDGTQDPYGDAVINMPLEFAQDQGLNNGLSFGEEGFVSPGDYGTNETMGDGGAHSDDLVGFGQNPGLGGFGMTSPPTIGNSLHNDFKSFPLPGPPLGGGDANFNRPWGATPTNEPTRNDGDRNLPLSTGPNMSKKENSGNTPPKDDGVVFRGWGDTSKTPEQPKRNWFWN